MTSKPYSYLETGTLLTIANYCGQAPAKRKRFLRNVTVEMASNFTKKRVERFLLFRNSRLKITDGTFAGRRCHYNDCCLCTAVNNKTR